LILFMIASIAGAPLRLSRNYARRPLLDSGGLDSPKRARFDNLFCRDLKSSKSDQNPDPVFT